MSKVLITGCSSGFGAASARRFAAEGHTVFAGVRQLGDAPAATTGTIVPVQLDITSDPSVRDAVARVQSESGRLDVLVNNAAVWLTGSIEETPIAEMARVLDVNVLGAMRMLHAVVPLMRSQGGGTIVTVSSVNGIVPMPYSGIYCASKFALEAMIEALTYEVRGSGIRNVLVEPGVFDTGLHRRAVRIGEQGVQLAEMAAAASESSPPLGVVVDAILGAAFDPTTPFRVPVGPDAEMLIPMRTSMAPDEFLAFFGEFFPD
jgi:NAD(P)-dependent dehydrogenase (short-subunit alcohol dehydrogenase family)